jgi:hypothetical protein
MLTDALAGVLVMVAYRFTTMSIAFVHNLSTQKASAIGAIMADLRDIPNYWAKSIVVFIAGFVVSCLIRQMIPSRKSEQASAGTH